MKTLDQSINKVTTQAQDQEILKNINPSEADKNKEVIDFFKNQTEFKVHNEQTQAMLNAAIKFCQDVNNKYQPRWLSFFGTKGIGKTLLSSLIKNYLKVETYQFPIRENNRFVTKKGYKCRNVETLKGYDIVDAIINDTNYYRKVNILLIDDITKGYNGDIFKQKLFQLIDMRLKKWTIITSNQCLKEFNKIDPGIADRFIRDGNQVEQLNMPSYSMAKVGLKF